MNIYIYIQATFVVIGLDCLEKSSQCIIVSIIPCFCLRPPNTAGLLLPLLQLLHGGRDLIGLLLQSMNHVVLLLHPVIGGLDNHSQHSIVAGLND